MKKRGLHIVFEGLDGGGKSTQAELLTERLRSLGYKVHNWREKFSEIVKQITKITSNPENTNVAMTTEVLIYAARAAQTIEEDIIPHLDKGDIVISVRYLPSLIAIFHFIRGVRRDFLETVNKFIGRGVKTDIVILCDADPQRAYQNVLARRKPLDRRELEGIRHFELMRQGFLALAKEEPEKWYLVNSLTLSEDKVAKNIWRRVRPLLKKVEKKN